MPTQSQKKLEPEIEKLTYQIKLLNSFSRRFLLGVVGGVGTAIGATIVASLLIFLLSRIIKSVNDVPILNNLIRTSTLDQIIDDQRLQP